MLQFTSLPFDLIKTRLQNMSADANGKNIYKIALYQMVILHDMLPQNILQGTIRTGT